MEIAKMKQLPYTVAIIKPDTTSSSEKVDEILEKIESSGLTIFDRKSVTLDKEFVYNLYSRHKRSEFYQGMIDYLGSGPSEVLLLSMDEGDPVSVWKSMIGASDPVAAKQQNAESLRAVYGSSWIRNEFHGSDNNVQANRERDIFDMPIPAKEPDFIFDKYKVSLDTLLKFIFPPHLEHSNVAGRLDLFALYGPVVNYHSVDLGCFCLNCARLGKAHLRNTVGMTTIFKKGKLSEGNQRLLKEEDIVALWESFCEKCRDHCENYSHLPSGRGGQHLLTDLEINQLISEVNRNELEELLRSTKGSSAKTIMMTLDLHEPKEMTYSAHHVRELFENVETDYYSRMNFYDMQAIILKDRITRMNYWISVITGKPVEQLPSFPQGDFRALPLSVTVEKKVLTKEVTQWTKSIVDNEKLGPNGEKMALLRRMHREASLIAETEALKSVDTANNIRLLRNYAPGKHGGWNNYVAIKHPHAHTSIYRRPHK